MSLREAFRIALRGLRAHRLRSVLTMLGIIIGVAAVILLVAIGNGVQSSVNAKIQPLANLITIVPSTGNVPGGGPPKDLIDDDVAALQQQVPDAAAVIPSATGQALAETGTTQFRSSVIGSTDRWLEVSNRDLQVGSFFDNAQVRSNARVVVIGSTAATTLFADPGAALSQMIRVNHQEFRVIGVMQSVGQPGDNDVVMPLNTARRYIFGGGDKLNQIIVQASPATAVPAAENDVIRTLTDRHRIQDPAKRDFEVQSLRSRLDTFNQVLSLLTLFTACVAAISLFVGSIGVLNIMLVSVTERTREIGVRKAIGATRGAILQQFLIESVVLAGLGGLIGVGVGVGLSVLGAAIAPAFGSTVGTFAPTVSIPSVVLSFAISIAIGLIAGGYPANRASRLRPVEALRYE
ncbi:MAG: macrolide ABC transporter permease [Pseudonocardiales bacterium]|nr:ABC transporter permease [Pseudonocardiales bacterium]PZS22105.1 MAG: macrolide ABC transporter permease [Pseudonocardiales bacterium]